jgi:hypothetical protein
MPSNPCPACGSEPRPEHTNFLPVRFNGEYTAVAWEQSKAIKLQINGVRLQTETVPILLIQRWTEKEGN